MKEVEKVIKPSVWRIFKSVLSAAIGVQSEKNRIEDFQSASIWPFLIGGIIFTAAFVGGLILLVTAVT
jgi:hypothetical protein